MTKVTKLLGGNWFAAALGLVLIAAFTGMFNFDGGANAAAPTFDRASAHVTGTSDLAPASSAAVPIRPLPGDIYATNTASAAGSSNLLTALPASLVSALNTYGTIPSSAFDPNAPSIAVSSLQQVDDTMPKTTTGRDIGLLDRLSAYMKIASINVSAAVATNSANNVDFLIGEGDGQSTNHYAAAIENVSGDTVQIIDPYVPAVLAGRASVLDNDNMFGTTVGSGATTAPTDYRLGLVNLTNAADQARFNVASDSDAGASLGTTHEAWYQTHVNTAALSDQAFLAIVAIVTIFAATCVLMGTSGGFSATNHRAARALGAG